MPNRISFRYIMRQFESLIGSHTNFPWANTSLVMTPKLSTKANDLVLFN